MVKNPCVSAGDAGDVGSIPESGRFPREGNGNPLQYSCLENPTDRGAWWGRKESDTTEGLSRDATADTTAPLIRAQLALEWQEAVVIGAVLRAAVSSL